MAMNILIFGPNGSGKGTQGAILQKRFNVPHIESGAIFRDHIRQGTELGIQARAFTDRGDLVPDSITVPMMIEYLQRPAFAGGWILDGFPRSKPQAITLADCLREANISINYVIEIVLDRDIARLRITGRRLCEHDNNHPNHIAFDAIKPVEVDGQLVCRVCGGNLLSRPDDQDSAAINKRHDIYYDESTGTMAAIRYFQQAQGPRVIIVDGSKPIDEISQAILAQI